ncbi:phosphoesterase PA-phosphatase-like protein [Catenovulum agarivorans DS-2]|uniref:undecaprenyl-diphosphate phosphatase n=1 Tax=Catenovulum agarivorans DS-2 TaxID=1328313 RepID=W7QS40_9ALTE|nr:phosphatase PAP2 family protein [Catenovulum agarivorans]EWH08220.1 phosphoesterase PA-phosphatase-like protein [Catenovulum agarivorans DS-2]
MIRFVALTAAVLLLVALSIYVLFDYHFGFIWLNQQSNLMPTTFWSVVTLFGDSHVAVALTLFLITQHKQLLPAALIATIPATLIAQSFKRGMPIDRPFSVLPEDSYIQIGRVLEMGSFPSGHTMTAAVWVGLFILFIRQNWCSYLLGGVLVLAGLSRIMVGAHWPIDVLVGAGVGLLCALFGYKVATQYQLGENKFSQGALFILPIYACFKVFTHNGGYPQGHPYIMILVAAAISYFIWLNAKPMYFAQGKS